MASPRFAILGYGNIGQRHAHILHHMPEVELVAIVEPDEAARYAAGELAKCDTFEDLPTFLEQGPEVNVLSVCTPNGWHYTHARQALEAGLHVLVEKPLALTAEACHQLSQQARQAGLGLYCVLQNRYSPPAQWLKEVMESRRLGQIYQVNVNCLWNRGSSYYQERSWRGTYELDGGPLYTQFSHFVDLLPWVLGPLTLEQGQFYNFNHQASTAFEDTGTLQLSLSSGAPVHFHYSTAVYQANLESSITILGEQGALKIGGQYMDQLVYCQIANYQAPTLKPANPPNQYGPFQGSAANHFQVLTNLVKALNGEPHELATAGDSTASIALIEQAYLLRAQQGIRTLVTPENRGQ